MKMNQKAAFKILGLGPGASLSQAKKAFRELAKQYHPDRYPSILHSSGLNSIDEIRAEQAEARMKQINQAFHFISPLLASADALTGNASKKEPIPRKKKTHRKTNPLFPLLRMLKKGLKFKRSRKVKHQPRPLTKQQVRSKQRKTRAVNRDQFATILHTIHPGAAAAKKNKDNGQGFRSEPRTFKGAPRNSRVNPYGNFIKYMDLKRKTDARSRNKQNFSRVEKISAVDRVKPIGDNHNA